MFSTRFVLLLLEPVKKLHLDSLEVDLSQWHDKPVFLCELSVVSFLSTSGRKGNRA